MTFRWRRIAAAIGLAVEAHYDHLALLAIPNRRDLAKRRKRVRDRLRLLFPSVAKLSELKTAVRAEIGRSTGGQADRASVIEAAKLLRKARREAVLPIIAYLLRDLEEDGGTVDKTRLIDQARENLIDNTDDYYDPAVADDPALWPEGIPAQTQFRAIFAGWTLADFRKAIAALG